MKDWLTIGQFAKEIGVSPKALRLYEDMGLLVSHARGENSYRYYSVVQVPLGKRLKELKALGFSLAELKSLLEVDAEIDSEKLITAFQSRLEAINQEVDRANLQKKQLQSLLTALKRKNKPLTGKERKSVMKFFEGICVVVTGVEDLTKTAEQICSHLRRGGKEPEIIQWNGDKTSAVSRPCIVVIPESALEDAGIETLQPDIVVVRNVSSSSETTLEKYLRLYQHVGPSMATVLNADDRASIELAAQPVLRKGKIFYFSKNSGVEPQIKKIGGIVSDGEEIRLYGFNSMVFGTDKAANEAMTLPLDRVLTFSDEVALIASLAAVLDIGLDAKQLHEVS